jgi:uncharacterized protein (DUF2147 family)
MGDMMQTWFSRIAAATLPDHPSGSLLRRHAKRLTGVTPILQRPLTLSFILFFAIFLCSATLKAQTSPFLGNWQVPSGTIVRVDPCSSDFCMRIVFVSPKADSTMDIHNPDASLRARSLCALEIGSRFHASDASHASGGTIYDPKSGNTYRGTMVVDGDTLRLRGYIGISLFGRTEIWHRVHASYQSCH